jgi:hypothetical protein
LRFVEGGPSIPDELLWARDQGRVVFFCGAGVSRAKTGLPDFLGLTEKVVRGLGVPPDDPALKILDEIRAVEKRTGIPGLVSLDRVFGALEREFLSSDIERTVASELRLPENPDLSAHKILLDLATTREGTVRIITTNFDRAFDHCGRETETWLSPRIPDPSHATQFNGIVHLHGKVGEDYQGAEGDGFILSSSEFGKAYLSDGWATKFVREILDKYAVVFIGYSADDPPIHYLLEALGRTVGSIENVYAFQSGDVENATAKWIHKGVTAIPYDPNNRHRMLWDTLAAWAQRARDPDKWISEIIGFAGKGPRELDPYIRGQVAHIVSTSNGVKCFSEVDNPPPAEWLCVFDKGKRYAKPGYLGDYQIRGPFVDPFDYYGLDSDTVPARIDPDDHYAKREIPAECWSAFSLTDGDFAESKDDGMSHFMGHKASGPYHLAPRFQQLGRWIGRISSQPATVWWAARQGPLHPGIRRIVRWELNHASQEISEGVRIAWRYLLEYWDSVRFDVGQDGYELVEEIEKEGWSNAVVRKYAVCFRPYLKIESPFGVEPIPPSSQEEPHWQQLIKLDVEYPVSAIEIEVPDAFLSDIVISSRKNLEIARDLEAEIGGYGLSGIAPINPSDDPDQNDVGRGMGLSGAVIRFSVLFKRVVDFDINLARSEYSLWMNDDQVFARLRIWAVGLPDLFQPDQATEVLLQLPDRSFWGSHHQRDLLLSLRSRWAEFNSESRGEIENRIVNGPDRWDQEDDEEYRERCAWSVLQRLSWLQQNGCALSEETIAYMHEQEATVEKWEPAQAVAAADSLEGRGGMVRSDTDYSMLADEPLSSTLEKAEELSGRQEDFLVEKRPFAGLASRLPVRTFAALRLAAKRGEFPEWAWRTFLNSEARKSDKPRFVAFIAEQLSRIGMAPLSSIVRPVADWVRDVSGTLSENTPDSFERIVNSLIAVLKEEPQEGRSVIQRRREEPDWVMEAINSPTGKLAQALFDHPLKSDLKTGQGYPTAWLAFIDDLLSLPGDLRRHALVVFTHNLDWFYAIDPRWSEQKLLSILETDSKSDQEAFWGGFFWGAKIPRESLYDRLKPYLLGVAEKGGLSRRGHAQVLSGIILAGWGSTREGSEERFVTDEEFRNVLIRADEDFRLQVLWQAQRWANSDDAGSRKRWEELLPRLFSDVWPKQISAKSPRVSERLCDLVFDVEGSFSQLADVVLPLLTKIERDHLMLPHLTKSRDGIADKHPKKMLEVLYAVLPLNAVAWPYDSGDTLARMLESDDSLARDERFIELKRRWDSR